MNIDAMAQLRQGLLGRSEAYLASSTDERLARVYYSVATCSVATAVPAPATLTGAGTPPPTYASPAERQTNLWVPLGLERTLDPIGQRAVWFPLQSGQALFPALPDTPTRTASSCVFTGTYVVDSRFLAESLGLSLSDDTGWGKLSRQLASRPAEAESTSKGLSARPHVRRFVRELFESAKDAVFEAGMESAFSRRLVSIVREFGVDAVLEIAEIVLAGQVTDEVAYEALRWLGRMEHPASHAYRLWLLTRSLGAKSPMVRDAAALGLALLDDPRAIPDLELAIADEKDEELRKDLEQVLRQLRATRT